MSAGQFLGQRFTWIVSNGNFELRMDVDKKPEVIFDVLLSFPIMFASGISCRSISYIFPSGCCMISRNVQSLYLDLPVLTVGRNLKRSVDFERLIFCDTYQKEHQSPFKVPNTFTHCYNNTNY